MARSVSIEVLANEYAIGIPRPILFDNLQSRVGRSVVSDQKPKILERLAEERVQLSSRKREPFQVARRTSISGLNEFMLQVLMRMRMNPQFHLPSKGASRRAKRTNGRRSRAEEGRNPANGGPEKEVSQPQ